MHLTIDLNDIFNKDQTNDNSLCVTYFLVAYLPPYVRESNIQPTLFGTHLCALRNGGAVK